MSISPASVFRADVIAQKAYQVHDSDGFIKMDANESPHPLPAHLKQALAERLANLDLNRYPDGAARHLKEKLLNQLGLSNKYDLLFGNGSDECIGLLMQAISDGQAKVMALEPTFVVYGLAAKNFQLNYVGVTLNEDFSVNVERTLAAIKEHQPKLLFLTPPNNPTGNILSAEDASKLIEATPGLVIIDEAYEAFSRQRLISLLDKHDNLLIMRTFSKIGGAGLRLGYLIGQQKWLIELDKIRMPYNINSLTQVAAEFLLDHAEVINQQVKTVIAARDSLISALREFAELTVYPSEANMFVVRYEKVRDLHSWLNEKKILVRQAYNWHPLLNNCIRISTGTAEENAALLCAISEFFKKQS
ncbi:histidinol-phosphate transaminase [Leeia sp. TBRC 13508]|uniref:Histidinol-phosphate aminotransferase n=1 Tax=Leeia speluncae TaxID=2884804 RepID=A0ABS8D648_9NEIS|nr:histidinol-phosphate transaminase [Leeia speluncae]MCB6183665.1 histidinol-phosphate transaminase [Leeia speluncae]